MNTYSRKNMELDFMIRRCDMIIFTLTIIMSILFIVLVDVTRDVPTVQAASEVVTIESIPIDQITPVKSYSISEPTTKYSEEEIQEKIVEVSMEPLISNPVRVIELDILEKDEPRMVIDDKTMEVLIRVVEAEVTGDSFRYRGDELTYEELLLCKIRVAQVFMNRVEDEDSFARIDSLYEALTEENASATFKDGRYYEVEITDISREACKLALLSSTPDYTDGALYFSSGTITNKYGDFLFTDDVGHSFFK